MASAEKKQEEIKLREVYLSDLKSVMNLYHSGLGSDENGSAKGLTADFGLPIGIAELNGRVVAYSRVNIDSKGVAVFKIDSAELSEVDAVLEDLNSFSVKRFGSIWGVEQELFNKPVVNAIDRLVDWLNHCN